MFRRRTDQVYSTLQQVQRRITEQTGMADQHDPLIQQPVVGRQPLEQVLPSGQAEMAPPVGQGGGQNGIPSPGVINSSFTQSPSTPSTPGYLNPGAARLGPGGKRYVLQLSGDMAMLLLVVWIASMAVMFVLGQYWRTTGGAGLAAGPAGNRDVATTPVGKRHGDHILLLQSAPTATVESVNFFEERARSLNDFVRQNNKAGWKPYFGVRKPNNGGVELAFGVVDGAWGINQSDYIDFAKLLSQPTAKGGAGYGQARWVKIEE
jgi:hypothetical protein